MRPWLLLTVLALAACRPSATTRPAIPATHSDESDAATRQAIGRILDTWHAAAAASDEEHYFALLTEDAVFLGTDATERWNKRAFQDFAHPHFEKGKGWKFRSTRRDIMVSPNRRWAWFDEDLATPNLGPCRGSGVLRKTAAGWRIVHYNLALTIPNPQVDAVVDLLKRPAEGAD